MNQNKIEGLRMKTVTYSTFANGRIKRTHVDGKLARMVAVLETGDIILTDKVRQRVLHRDRVNGGAYYLAGLTDPATSGVDGWVKA